MDVYWISFFTLIILEVVLWFFQKPKVDKIEDAQIKRFTRTYLVVYLLAMAGDWMQGPYVYALYRHYGKDEHQIEQLFVAGFGSSMLFGTVVGSFADKCGRKLNCQLYAVLYIFSCVTKHFSDLWILMIGRLLGGVATSILFSSFESWLICEHNKRGFCTDGLSTIFSQAVFANCVVAIGSGQLAQVAVDKFGFVAPFDVSIGFLLILLLAVSVLWTENYGDSESSLVANLQAAKKEIFRSRSIFCLGLLQALFEGAMYTFVLKWTPALTPDYDATKGKPPYIPHGLIFSSFMVCVMIGSTIFNMISSRFKTESFMRIVFLCATLSFAAALLFPQSKMIILFSFFIFEICVGIFWPAMGTMRSEYVPESVRSTVMNIFRVPLNIIVILMLLQNLSLQAVFTFCMLSLGAAVVVQQVLYSITRSNIPSPAPGVIDIV